MANSFGDQLLKAGLVSKDKLNKAKKSKYKQQKSDKKNKDREAKETAVLARRAAAENASRDRELNRQQKEEAERKAIQAQVRQLIELNRLPRDGGEAGYNFQDGTAVKKLFVTEEIREKLGRGLLAIVRFDSGYEVIPSIVAEKIMLRDASCVVSHKEKQDDVGDDDPYADYKVPDDLMW
ncbi:hypothetical protein MNBD_GAMMA15-1208 [hydrothermal vent metagenome]|uniref:Nucleoprotein/polynucleotide-associated enzyme n=1 Tax=hydrothermal vent metagenome TaxID=652676 RepID=A0A3B0YL11_9ZZZZ